MSRAPCIRVTRADDSLGKTPKRLAVLTANVGSRFGLIVVWLFLKQDVGKWDSLLWNLSAFYL